MNVFPVKLTQIKQLVNFTRVNFACADIESLGTKSDKFRCGSIYYIENKVPCLKTFFNFLDFFYECSIFDAVYFFNLGYDSNYFLNHIIDNFDSIDYKFIGDDKKLGMIVFQKPTLKNGLERITRFITLKDFFPIVQMSLESASILHNTYTQKFNVDFDNCSNVDIQHHCENDVKILHELITIIRKQIFDAFKVDILKKKFFSIASIAMAVFRANFIKSNSSLINSFLVLRIDNSSKKLLFNQKLYDFVKETYKGGFVNAFNTNTVENTRTCDISSSYPFAMSAIRFPTGFPEKTTDYSVFFEKTRSIPGFCYVKLKIISPFLCVHRENKLILCSGIVKEHITSFELDYVLSRHYAELIEFIEGIYFTSFDRTNSLLHFVIKLFSEKEKYTDSRREIYKYILNPLYGKFGQKPLMENKKYLKVLDFHEYQGGECECIERNGTKFVIITESTESLKSFMFVSWASLISAFGRIYLMQSAIDTNANYVDTDSLNIFDQNLPKLESFLVKPKGMKKILGFFYTESEYLLFRALAPKLYASIDKKYVGSVKAKGVVKSRRLKLLTRIFNNKDITTSIFIKILGSSEGFRANRPLISKSGFFGGIDQCVKHLTPKNKAIIQLNE
jgi:hypothetical protein